MKHFFFLHNDENLLSQHCGNNGEIKTLKKERNISVMFWRKIYFTIHNKKYMKILVLVHFLSKNIKSRLKL